MRTHSSGSGVPVERRTRRDLVTVAVIVVVMAVTAAAILLSGSAAGSQFRTADAEQPVYGPATGSPTSVDHLWSHPTAATGAPLTTKGNLVTVDPDGTLVGRDAGSGEQTWSYSHAGEFCAATFYSDRLVAAFDGVHGCSDVTALSPTEQQYASTRQSAFADHMTLTSTWRHALAFSPERLEIWRDDLVRTVEYGAVAAPQEADMQPRTGCTFSSADLTDARFAVTENCPGEDSVRLTLSETVPEDSRKPEEIASDTTGADGLWIIDVRDEGVLAVADRDGVWAVEWLTSPTDHTVVMPLDRAPAVIPSPESLSGDSSQVRWFDGHSTHAFATGTGRHMWSLEGTTGPGLTGGWSDDPDATTARDWVLVPYRGGFTVADHATGQQGPRFPATAAEGAGGGDMDDDDTTSDPATYDGAANSDGAGNTDGAAITGLAQVGDILYEYRDGLIHAYKMVS